MHLITRLIRSGAYYPGLLHRASKCCYYQVNDYEIITSELLNGRYDAYNGVLIDSQTLPGNVQQFVDNLKYSLKVWESDDKKAIWLELKQNQFDFVSHACRLGFNVHHAQKDYIMLTKWIDKKEAAKTPDFSSHYISCGGVVINQKNEVMLIKEQFGHNKNHWRIPSKL